MGFRVGRWKRPRQPTLRCLHHENTDQGAQWQIRSLRKCVAGICEYCNCGLRHEKSFNKPCAVANSVQDEALTFKEQGSNLASQLTVNKGNRMNEQQLATHNSQSPELEGLSDQPLLFRRREYLESIEASASTTSCQSTSGPSDYGPDD